MSMSELEQKALLAEVSALAVRYPIETERTRLRPFREEDFQDYFVYARQKEQQRLSGNAAIETEAEAREVFDWFLSQQPPLSFVIELKAEGRVVGNLSFGLHPYLTEHEKLRNLSGVCLSFVLGEDYQRRGLMTEVLRAVIDWCFEVPMLDYVNAGYFTFNLGSKKLMEKCGMEFLGNHVYTLRGETIPTEERVSFRPVTRAERESCSVHLTRDGGAVEALDQRALPNREIWLRLETLEELREAIRTLAVRGAPAIGIAAGYGMYVLARRTEAADYVRFCETLRGYGALLAEARPTAVNLRWAVERMLTALEEAKSTAEATERLRREAVAIHDEDILMCRRIAEYGLSLVKSGDGILTHCNAGPLATSRYGTALGPILLGKERGIELRVFADETRPLLQGARLTSYELHKAGVDVTLICDNMASIVMKQGLVQAVFVGCDRIAANGDFANKIGTSGVAILAKHYGIPFYTLGPASTVDLSCPTGEAIPIEERDPEELRSLWYREPMAPAGVNCYNPAFDVTDHSLVTAIVTDRGILYPPFEEKLRALFG